MSNEAKDLFTEDDTQTTSSSKHAKDARTNEEHQSEAVSSNETSSENGTQGPFAFDINQKIDELHSELDELTTGFTHSKQAFSTSLDDLTARITKEAKQIAEQIKKSDKEKLSLINELEIRLTDSSAKSIVLINDLEKSFEQNDAEKRALISDLEQHIEKTSSSINHEIGSIHEHLSTQQSGISNLQKELDNSNKKLEKRISQLSESTQKHIEALVQADKRQEKTQRVFADHLDELRAKTNTTEDNLQDLQVDYSSHKKTAIKTFKIASSIAAVITLAITGTMTYLHYNDKAVLDSKLAAFQTVISETFSSKSDLATLSSEVSENRSSLKLESLKIQESLGDVNSKVAALELSLYGEKDVPGQVGTPKLTLHGNEWIQAQNPNNFIIQLVGVYRERSVIAFANRFAKDLTEFPLSSNMSQHRGQDWHNLYYGSFTTFDEAQRALDALPRDIQRNNPWIRRIEGVNYTGL